LPRCLGYAAAVAAPAGCCCSTAENLEDFCPGAEAVPVGTVKVLVRCSEGGKKEKATVRKAIEGKRECANT